MIVKCPECGVQAMVDVSESELRETFVNVGRCTEPTAQFATAGPESMPRRARTAEVPKRPMPSACLNMRAALAAAYEKETAVSWETSDDVEV